MDLKKILGEELYNKLVASGDIKAIEEKLNGAKLIVDDGQLIPKYRLDEVSNENKTLKTQIEDQGKQLKDLKKAAEGNEALVKQIDDYQKANKLQSEQHEQEKANIKKSFAVKEHLFNAGVNDPDARELLSSKFPLDKVELDGEGKIKGFEEMLKPIKENKTLASLFGTKSTKGTGHKDGEEEEPKKTKSLKEEYAEMFH